jgi:hypothetical protein
MATPKGHRKKDITVEMHAISPLPLNRHSEHEIVASNGLHKTPKSIRRFTNGSKLGNENRCNVTAIRSTSEGRASPKVQATPSRCQVISNASFSAKFEDHTSRRDGELPTSPLRARRFDEQSLPGALTCIAENLETPSRAAVIHGTPIKLSTEYGAGSADSSMKPIGELESTIAIQKQETNENESFLLSRIDDDSIYKTLGWDEDDLA